MSIHRRSCRLVSLSDRIEEIMQAVLSFSMGVATMLHFLVATGYFCVGSYREDLLFSKCDHAIYSVFLLVSALFPLLFFALYLGKRNKKKIAKWMAFPFGVVPLLTSLSLTVFFYYYKQGFLPIEQDGRQIILATVFFCILTMPISNGIVIMKNAEQVTEKKDLEK